MRHVILALSILGVLSVLTTRASALPRYEVERVYYADRAMTREVGSEIRPSCSGRGSALQGRRTRYFATFRTPCEQGSGHHTVACYVDNRATYCPANICDSPLFECH